MTHLQTGGKGESKLVVLVAAGEPSSVACSSEEMKSKCLRNYPLNISD